MQQACGALALGVALLSANSLFAPDPKSSQLLRDTSAGAAARKAGVQGCPSPRRRHP